LNGEKINPETPSVTWKNQFRVSEDYDSVTYIDMYPAYGAGLFGDYIDSDKVSDLEIGSDFCEKHSEYCVYNQQVSNIKAYGYGMQVIEQATNNHTFSENGSVTAAVANMYAGSGIFAFRFEKEGYKPSGWYYGTYFAINTDV